MQEDLSKPYEEEEENELSDDNAEDDEYEHQSDEGQAGEDSDEDRRTFSKAELEEYERKIRRDQDKRWKERKSKQKPEAKSEKREVATDTVDRYYLDSKGIEEDDAQDIVLDYAKYKNISVREALKSDIVKAELAAKKKKQETEDSIPAPSRRTSNQNLSDNVAYWVRKLTKEGKNAPTAEMRSKVRKYLAENGENV